MRKIHRLINRVILVLREVLEASLLSLLLALTQIQKMSARWVVPPGLGFFVASVYALATRAVSQWFDDTGQVVNASMQYIIYLLILAMIVTVIGAESVNTRPR